MDTAWCEGFHDPSNVTFLDDMDTKYNTALACVFLAQMGSIRRRRIETEEKAKVFFGEEFIKFLAALAVFPRTILSNRMNCTRMI